MITIDDCRIHIGHTLELLTFANDVERQEPENREKAAMLMLIAIALEESRSLLQTLDKLHDVLKMRNDRNQRLNK